MVLSLAGLIPATAVIEVAEVSTVKLRLVEHGIDFVVNEASPTRGGVAR